MAFDTTPKLKVGHLKRARRIFRLDLDHLAEEEEEEERNTGVAAFKDNYILAESRRLCYRAREFYRQSYRPVLERVIISPDL